MHPKRLLGLVGVVAAAAVLITSAGAGTNAPAKPNFSTDAGVLKYLKSLGVNPKGVVIQRGLRNYAGPQCPGRLWRCTRSTKVFQVAKAGGQNQFECTDQTVEPEGQFCVSEQFNENGDNVARCIERSDTETAQTCDITQVNVNGDNRATVLQEIRQNLGGTQSADQRSAINQINLTGDNNATADQGITQVTKVVGDQSQSLFQQSCVKQHQAATPGDPCQDAVPATVASGRYSSNVSQAVRQQASGGASTIMQTQDSNVVGHVSQETLGLAQNQNFQHEVQIENGALVQIQHGPLTCCTSQGSNPKDKFHIHQQSEQHTSSKNSAQTELIAGQCESSGNCHVEQNANQNGNHLHVDCQSPSCNVGIVCASAGASESEVGSCEPCDPFVSEGETFCFVDDCSEFCESFRTALLRGTGPKVSRALARASAIWRSVLR